CSGTSLTFSSNITNGGSSPVYQWKKNGNNVATNSPTYSTSTLNDNDVISCSLTSSLNCASPATVNSGSITVSVGSTVQPTISISSPSNTICSGTNLTFSSNITNGGSSPIYQWKKNGGNVATNSSTYTTSTLNDKIVIASC